MIDADHLRWLSEVQGLELPEEDLVPVASALSDLMMEIRKFDTLEFPSDDHETRFDVDWHLRTG
jgi:hypothetical protein